MLVKFLLIVFVIFLVFRQMFRFLGLRTYSQAQQQQRQRQSQQQRGYSQQRTQQRQAQRPSDGNVNIDFIPDNKKKRKQRSGGTTNSLGEYVDFEEVD